MKKIIYLLVLTIVLAGGAVAQKTSKQAILSSTDDPTPIYVPVEPGDVKNFSGTESAEATLDKLNKIYRGNSFAIICEQDAYAASMAVSIDYSPVSDQPGSYAIKGGSWTLTIYEDGEYVGVLYGDIPEGSIIEVTDSDTGDVLQRSISANFRVVGGMDRFANTVPEEIARGSYVASTDYTDRKQTTASLKSIF